MGQITATRNLVAIKVVRHAGQLETWSQQRKFSQDFSHELIWDLCEMGRWQSKYVLNLEGSIMVAVLQYPFINTLRPRQDGRHFPDDIFNCIFLNENVRISLEISLKFVPRGPSSNIPALIQKMAWRRSGDKPLSEPVMVNFLTHICVTRP